MKENLLPGVLAKFLPHPVRFQLVSVLKRLCTSLSLAQALTSELSPLWSCAGVERAGCDGGAARVEARRRQRGARGVGYGGDRRASATAAGLRALRAKVRVSGGRFERVNECG
jgi:hypothetical protein